MAWLWIISLVGLLYWLLGNRKAFLQSPVWWKPMAFISLGFGSLTTLAFWIAFAVIFVYDGDIWEMLAFYRRGRLLFAQLFHGGHGYRAGVQRYPFARAA